MPQIKTIILFFSIAAICITPFALKAQCGVERWSVKVLNDADTNSINWLPVISTVEEQDKFPKEAIGFSTPRLPSEKTVYQIEGDITFFKREPDQDIHLILVGKDSSMVIEIPSPDCPEVQGTSRAPIYAAERAWVSANFGIPNTSFKPVVPPQHVRVTGLSFQDFGHGQRGIGANARELHPILSITDASDAVITGIHSAIAKIRIVPNPVSGDQCTLTIDPGEGELISQVSVCDLSGREVLRPETPKFFRSEIELKVSTSALPAGAYFLRVVSLSGAIDTKFIIQR